MSAGAEGGLPRACEGSRVNEGVLSRCQEYQPHAHCTCRQLDRDTLANALILVDKPKVGGALLTFDKLKEGCSLLRAGL